MNLLRAKGNWNIFRGMLKQACARLIHNDQQFFEGKAEELTGRIQMQSSKRGKTTPSSHYKPQLTSHSTFNSKA